MATIGNTSSYSTATSTTAHNGTITLGSASRRKVVLLVMIESATTVPSSITIDGGTPTAYGSTPEINPNDTNLRIRSYYVDIPTGVGAGSKDINVTASASDATVSWHAFEVIDAEDGAPETVQYGHTNGGAATATVTSTASAALTAAAMLHASTQTIAWTGSVTENNEVTSTVHVSGGASASAVSSGSRTATATPNSGARTSVHLASWAAYSGGSPSNAPRSMFYHNFGMR
jgi:hypothetical protein